MESASSISLLNAAQFMAAPLVMSLILAGIHCYLGLHVLARGVIFVDLSLAQVAAFGATLAILFGFEHNGMGTYFFSLTTTFIAAALFALARKYEHLFSQEAIIGIVYALASAAVVLVVDRIAHGAEHIKDLLIGHVLWVTWFDVGKTAFIYSAVGLIHFVYRKPLIQASFEGGESGKSGGTVGLHSKNRSALWDFVFYALFGIVITSSVRVAGVLQVFAYLIVPAVVSTVYFQSIRHRLYFGWALSAILSAVGMFLSFRFDFPAGAFMVVLFGLAPLLLLLLSPLFTTKSNP